MVKIRVHLSEVLGDKRYIDGDLNKEELEELKCFGCLTLTLGKITINTCKITGWEVI